MSNFSEVYDIYLQGYASVDRGMGACTTERLAQALALGVHHRTTGKPPLMRSKDVTAALRGMKEGYKVVLTNAGANKIGVIKVVREMTNLGLKKAKDIVDLAGNGATLTVDSQAKASEWKRLLEGAGATVEIR